MDKFIKIGLGVVVGGLIGYLILYKVIGCSTGTCPITKSPYSSIVYGAMLGGLVGSGA